MERVNLLSESFERAAYTLSHSMDNFNRSGTFEEAVSQFRASVDKLQRLLGMQAENDFRKICGNQVAYVEDDFASL